MLAQLSSGPYFIFALIAIAAIAMASNKVRYDFIAVSVLLALVVSGSLTVTEAFAGFGHPVVILVACLLVVGEVLDRTGVASRIGEVITQAGGTSLTVLLALLMTSAALLSSVMSSTAVVAIFIPIVIRIAQKTQINQSLMLLPVAYAALTSGMITLIATPPNLVINDLLVKSDGEGLGFFEFAPLGLIVLLSAVAYFVVFGKYILKEKSVTRDDGGTSGGASPSTGSRRSFVQMWQEFDISQCIFVYRIPTVSQIVGQTIAQSQLDSRFSVRVLAIQSQAQQKVTITSVDPDLVLNQGDTLVVTGTQAHCEAMCRSLHLTLIPTSDETTQNWLRQIGASTLLVHPEGNLVNRSLIEYAFRTKHGAQVLAVKREGQLLPLNADTVLKSGDMLFVVGAWKKLKEIHLHSSDLILLETPEELNLYQPAAHKGMLAVGIVVAMVMLKLLNLVPITIAAVMAVVACILTRCISASEAYRSIHWNSIVLIAGMLPLATALEQSGGTQLIVDAILMAFGDVSAHMLMAVLFCVTTAFTLILSNTTSAVLMTPIAIGVASSLGISPYPLAIAVLMGASSAFASPVSTPVVTLVVEPGKYAFSDFLRNGGPLTVIALIVTLLVGPILFPF